MNLVISFRRTLLPSLRGGVTFPSWDVIFPSWDVITSSLQEGLKCYYITISFAGCAYLPFRVASTLPTYWGSAVYPPCIGVNLPFRLPERILYPSNCGSAITSVLFLVSPPTYSNRDCCGRPELSVMCSGDIQGFTDEQLKIWLEGATNIPFVHIIKKTHKAYGHIHFGSHSDASKFFHRYKDLTMDGPQKIGIRICASKYFNTNQKVVYLEVPGNKTPRIDPPSTILETEEQRNHEEELEKARKEKRPEIYNEGRPGNKKPRIDKTREEIYFQEQLGTEEHKKEIPFAICDDVESAKAEQ